MKILKKSCPLWVTIVALVAVISVALAAIKFTVDLPSTITVKADYTLQVLAEDKTTIIASFDFGEMDMGETIEADNRIYIKNIGNIESYVAWSITGLPAGFEMHCYDTFDNTEVLPNDFSVSVLPDEYWDPIDNANIMSLKFELTNIGAGPAIYDFTISFHAADSSSG